MMKDDFFKPLNVNLTGKMMHHYDEKSILPAHELVIRPLLENAIETFVYRGRKEDTFLYNEMQDDIKLEEIDTLIKLEEIDVLIKNKGKFTFDKTKECITGNEYLWNACAWKRGSIVFILKEGQVNFAELFKNTYRPAFTETPNSGNTPSATKKCREALAQGLIAICLPASNGIEWMNIYASGQTFENIMKQAEDNCQEKNYYK